MIIFLSEKSLRTNMFALFLFYYTSLYIFIPFRSLNQLLKNTKNHKRSQRCEQKMSFHYHEMFIFYLKLCIQLNIEIITKAITFNLIVNSFINITAIIFYVTQKITPFIQFLVILTVIIQILTVNFMVQKMYNISSSLYISKDFIYNFVLRKQSPKKYRWRLSRFYEILHNDSQFRFNLGVFMEATRFGAYQLIFFYSSQVFFGIKILKTV